MFQRCAAGGEHDAPAGSDAASQKRRTLPGKLMSEDEAKAQGYREGAHKVNCST
jgi:hypothetical protein